MLLMLVVKQTVAKTLNLGVCYLFSELFANTLCVFASSQTARAVPSVFFELLANHRNSFLILRYNNFCHIKISFLRIARR